jgi:hypothetical protein
VLWKIQSQDLFPTLKETRRETPCEVGTTKPT